MTRSRCGKLYIDDAGWGPDAASIEYGYRVPFGGIHVFIGKIGEPGPEPDICTDLVETAQRARPARTLPALKRAFVGCIHGGLSEGSGSGDEMAARSDGESSTDETNSLYQLQDGRLRGCSDGDSIPDPFEPPSRVGIFMAGTQPGLAAQRGPEYCRHRNNPRACRLEVDTTSPSHLWTTHHQNRWSSHRQM